MFTRDRNVSRPRHSYNGHRRSSFIQEDADELVELRARQRTFDGAYVRTALGNFGYALIILKVFSTEFARIGLLYVILAVLLLLVSLHRAKRSDADFADIYKPAPAETLASAIDPSPRIWGRPFRTSGQVVVLVGIVVVGLYSALFACVLKLA